MAKDYVKLTAKSMIRKGNIEEAIQYLVEKGYTIDEARNTCIDLKLLTDKEQDD
jgi:hypothetical protein